MEPTVYQAPILHERQYRATSREIQGAISLVECATFLNSRRTPTQYR
jgi:hypothetical protein